MDKTNDDSFNPENLPAEKLTLSVTNAGVIQQVKALDTFWVEKREMTVYERPPSGSALVFGALDAWKTKMEGYSEDLKWLLSLEHHRFWSNILYHPQCMDSLVSFLQEASPPYLPPHESRDVQKLYEEIRSLVLIVFCRLITNKESKSKWMTKEYMSNLIYDNFIFTIPIIWDICLVYGIDNAQHISRMLSSIFESQPQYQRDLVSALAFVNEAFRFIILQVNKHYDSEEPPNLPETFKGFSEIKRPPSNSKKQDNVTFDVLKDLVIHMLDTTMTLRIFIEAYPKCVPVLRKTNFILSIIQLYEYGIPKLYEKLQEVGDETSITYTELEGYIDSARAEIIDIFREILAVYKNAVFREEGSVLNHVEEFLSVLMESLSEKLLLHDYNACYPLHEDLELLKAAYPQIDTMKTDFILQAIYSNLEDATLENTQSSNPGTIINGYAETKDNNQPTTSRDTEIPDNIKEESLISEVKDILPHLGDGFILKCLRHYGFNSERVVSSILEGNLAEPLKSIDQSLPIIPEDPLDKKYLETGIERLNVFDGDEFDIMSRDDVDLNRIHVGKRRSKYKDLKDMLDDKSDVKKLSDIYSKYNLVCDEVSMYSDEYDDTYDSDGGGVPVGDATTDDARRPLVTPRVLQTKSTKDNESSAESEPNEETAGNPGASSSRNKLDFCTNPEEMRARREANFQARRGKGHRPPPNKNTDVTGKPRGQGQEKEVLANRDRKEKHKSSRGNHNRRQGAQWKRSQGMMPS